MVMVMMMAMIIYQLFSKYYCLDWLPVEMTSVDRQSSPASYIDFPPYLITICVRF